MLGGPPDNPLKSLHETCNCPEITRRARARPAGGGASDAVDGAYSALRFILGAGDMSTGLQERDNGRTDAPQTASPGPSVSTH